MNPPFKLLLFFLGGYAAYVLVSSGPITLINSIGLNQMLSRPLAYSRNRLGDLSFESPCELHRCDFPALHSNATAAGNLTAECSQGQIPGCFVGAMHIRSNRGIPSPFLVNYVASGMVKALAKNDTPLTTRANPALLVAGAHAQWLTLTQATGSEVQTAECLMISKNLDLWAIAVFAKDRRQRMELFRHVTATARLAGGLN